VTDWVKGPDGEDWGTVAQIATHLQHGVTHAMVRGWANYYGLPKARITDAKGRPRVVYPVAKAAEIELRMRNAGRGTKRKLDTNRHSSDTAHEHDYARVQPSIIFRAG
jgi:hypothetical protein